MNSASASIADSPFAVVEKIEFPVGVGDASQLAELLPKLRSAMERSQRVSWSASGDIEPQTARSLEHLPPPQHGGGAGGDFWRQRHTYGGFYFRVGPGFVVLRDRRSTRDAAVYTLSGEALTCWRSALKPDSQHRCAVCDTLFDEDVFISLVGRTFVLPFRLRFPPVPFLSV